MTSFAPAFFATELRLLKFHPKNPVYYLLSIATMSENAVRAVHDFAQRDSNLETSKELYEKYPDEVLTPTFGHDAAAIRTSCKR